MRKAFISLALVLLMLLPNIAIPAQAQIQFSVWPDKPQYHIGETVILRVQPAPAFGVALWFVITAPDGSQTRTLDLTPGRGWIDVYANKILGRHRADLWAQVVAPNSTPELVATCSYEIVEVVAGEVKYRGTVEWVGAPDYGVTVTQVLAGAISVHDQTYVTVWGSGQTIGDILVGGEVELLGECPSCGTPSTQYQVNVHEFSHYIEATGVPPVCGEGAVNVLKMCPDGQTWSHRQECRNNAWVEEYQQCPAQPCDVMQMVPKLEEAMNAAVESSTFNINEGGSVSGEILSDIAVFVATTGFEKGIERGLKISLDKLPKKTQVEIALAEQVLGNKAADELSSSARVLSLDIAKLYANYRGEPSAVNIDGLTGIYKSHFDYFRTELTDIVKAGACPRFGMQYWSQLLDYYVSAVRSSKDKSSFYVSFWRIGTIGQSAEARRWWNSPLKDLSDYSLLALQIAYIFALPEGQVIPTLMEAGAAVAKAAIYATILQQIVEENVLMYQDYFVLTRAMLEALRNPDLYSAPSGTVTSATISPVSLVRSGTGEIKYDFSWNVPMDVAASLAFFDPSGKVLFWQMGATQWLSSPGQATWTLTYPYPGITYALQHRKMKYKLFIHNLASTSFQDYLVGPIEGEVDVGILSTKSTLIQLQEQAHKLFLHAYDSNGRHVGVDHATGEVQVQIPGAYYSDEGHVSFVALPADFTDFRITVDATGAEEPVESFGLTISLLDGSNVMLQRTKSSDIQKGESAEYVIAVAGNAEISITNVTVTSTTTAQTTTPQSILDWIMNELKQFIHWLECFFLKKCG